MNWWKLVYGLFLIGALGYSIYKVGYYSGALHVLRWQRSADSRGHDA